MVMTMAKLDEDRFAYLTARSLCDNATGDELAELKELLTHSEPGYGVLYRCLADAPDSRQLALSEEEVLRAYHAHMRRMRAAGIMAPGRAPGKRGPGKYLQRIAIPAAAAIALAVALVAIDRPARENLGPYAASADLVEYSIFTAKGEKRQCTMPDGTVVWLNGGSRITYTQNFNKSSREITLSGEAFFDVERDTVRPFIIHTKDMNIRVVGTTFNVRAYDSEPSSETVLVSGKVEVTLNGDRKDKIVLAPNERVSVTRAADLPVNATPVVEKSQAKFISEERVNVSTCWVDNKLVFSGDPLHAIASKISQWYDVEVIIVDSSLRDQRYSGIFEDKSLAEVLYALSRSGNFAYRIESGSIVLLGAR